MSIAKGIAKIKHSSTGIVYEIPPNEVEFDIVGGSDRQMGPENAYEGICHHTELGDLTWRVWEYPVGAENYREVDVGSHEILEDFTIDFHEPDEDELYDLEQEKAQQNRQERIDIMVEWFFERFEDPVHETPYNGREGGYLFINGGPYDATDELQNNFHDEDHEIIEAAVAEIESDGTLDWAPVRGSDEYILDEPDIPPASNPNAAPSATDFEAEIRELESLIDSLPPSQAHPNFEMRDDGLLHFAQPPDASIPQNDDPILTELRQAVDDLLNSLAGTNAHTDLLEKVESYSDAINTPEISISVVYARGIKLDNMSSVIKERISQDELPPIPHGADAHLKSVLDLHGSFIMSTEEGRTLLENSSAFQRTPDETEALSQSMRQIAKSIDEMPQLISQEVREEVAANFSEIDSGKHPERSNQIAGNTLGQIASTILKSLQSLSIAALIGGAIATSGIGASIISSGGVGIDTAVSFLVNNLSALQVMTSTLAADISWMQPMAEIFQRISNIKVGNKHSE